MMNIFLSMDKNQDRLSELKLFECHYSNNFISSFLSIIYYIYIYIFIYLSSLSMPLPCCIYGENKINEKNGFPKKKGIHYSNNSNRSFFGGKTLDFFSVESFLSCLSNLIKTQLKFEVFEWIS